MGTPAAALNPCEVCIFPGRCTVRPALIHDPDEPALLAKCIPTCCGVLVSYPPCIML